MFEAQFGLKPCQLVPKWNISVMLKDLIISKVRVAILELFFGNPYNSYHVREITRKIEEEINAVRRELAHLNKRGILTKEARANRLYYSLRKDYPLYYELLEIIAKTTGIGGSILKNRPRLGKIKYVMLNGAFARGLKKPPDSIDLLIVGNVVIPEVARLVHEEEVKREVEINFTPMPEDEFNFRKTRRDPFLMQILNGSRIMIIGDEEEFVR